MTRDDVKPTAISLGLTKLIADSRILSFESQIFK